jgi:aminopeptidase YwaD
MGSPLRVTPTRLAAATLALAMLVSVSAGWAQLALPTPANASQTEAAPAFSGARARQHVDALAGHIGSRPAGSASYDEAVRYAVGQFQQWGYPTSLQTFPVQTYADRGSQLDVIDPGTGALPAATLQYSVAGQVEAPLVHVGLGRPEDLTGLDLHGKVALVKRGVLRFSDKVANVAGAGAVGAIVYNDSPGGVQGTLASPQPIPSVTVSGSDGRRLLDALAGGGSLVVRLSVDGSIEQRSATNVVADAPGGSPKVGRIVVGAHLDSVPAGPGANDNSSGSSVVLELARVLAGRDQPYTVHFVLFGAEELGLLGSQRYVASLSPADLAASRAMINLDMVGVGQAWRFGGTEDLVQRALGATSELGERGLPLRDAVSSGSDHASFLAAGVPALFIYRVEDPNYHTAGDRAELVDPTALEAAGTIALRVLASLAADATAQSQ